MVGFAELNLCLGQETLLSHHSTFPLISFLCKWSICVSSVSKCWLCPDLCLGNRNGWSAHDVLSNSSCSQLYSSSHPPAAIAPSKPHTSQTLSQLLTLLPFTQGPSSHTAVMLPLLSEEFSSRLGCWFVTLSFLPALEQRCNADLAFTHYFETSQAFLCSFNSLSSSSWIGTEWSVINYVYYRGKLS